MAGIAFGSDQDWRQWSLVGTGLLLFIILLAISTLKPVPLFANPIELTYPIILAIGVTTTGVVVLQANHDPADIWRLTRGAVIGTVVFVGLSLWGVFLVFRADGSITLAVNSVTAVIATGAGIGVVLGEYDRRQRQQTARADLVEAAVKNAIDGVAILNADGEYVMVNQAHAELYGYNDPEAMVGETWRICYGEETREEFEEDVMPTLSEEGVWRGEAEGVRTDGTTFPQELSLTTLSDGGLVCVVRDISERVDREQELTSTTNLLSTLVGNIPVGILAEDSDRNLLFTNQEFCDIFGIEASPEELIGSDCEAAAERVKDLFVDPERFINRTTESVERETPIDQEEYDLVDGRTLERSAIPVDLDGEESGYLWVYHDVTERTQYERRLNALHETTRELMTAETHEEITTQASDAASDILDLPLNGIHLYDDTTEGLVPVAWSSGTDALIGEPPVFSPGNSIAWQVFETGDSRVHDDAHAEDKVYDPDTPIRSEIVLPLGTHGVFLVGETTTEAFDQTDITLAKILAANVESALDRADREQELREREAELARQNEQLDEFASVLSHDLRNPLNVAKGRLTLIESEEHNEHLEAIRRAHERMEALIEDVLTLARQGQTVGEAEPVPVTRPASKAWEQIQTDTATIDIDIDREIKADESRLQQLFENLFRNAIEHGGPAVAIRVGALDDGSGFYVADDGSGIPLDERDRIFDHGYSTAAEGTGFGLAIVQQIVQAHGWTISVADSAGGGARFEIRGIVESGDQRD